MKIKRIILSVLLILTLFTSQTFAYEINADYNVQTFNFVLEGQTSSGDFGKPISVLLTNKNDNSVGHIGMTEVKADGSYTYKFYFDGDIDEYDLKVRLDGTDLTGTVVNKIETFSDLVLMDVKLKNKNDKPFSFSTDEKLNFTAVLNNAFEDNTQFTVICAFYNKNGKLLDCKMFFDGTLDFFDFEKTVTKNDIDVPTGANSLKIMCFKGFSSMKPLNSGEKVQNASGLELYVSPEGSATGDGSINNPFSTVEQAQKKIRDLKTTGAYPDGEIIVYLRDGKYFINSTIKFTSADCGMEKYPITYKAYENEKPVLTGGKYLKGSDFSNITSSDAMYEKIPESVRNKVLKVDLKVNGISYVADYANSGASFPGGINLLKTEIFVDNEACRLARWPNENSNGISNFVYSEGVITNSKDTNTKPVLKVTEETYNKLNGWSGVGTENEIFCEGWFGWQFDFESVSIDSIAASQLTLSQGVRGGFYPAGTEHLSDEEKDGSRNKFYFSNVIEELDKEYEYYIDRQNGILYFCPPETFNENSEIGIPQFEDKMVTVYDGADFINFEGITFELNKNAHLCIDKSKNINVKNCNFINSSYESVVIDNSYRYANEDSTFKPFYGTLDNENFVVETKNINLENCNFRNMGKGAIISAGGNLRTLERANYNFRNCTFDSVDRIRKNYASAIQFLGCGATVTNCLMKNQFGMAMLIGGSDIYVAYNEFDNVVGEASDCGAIYSQTFSYGTDISNNYFHDINYRTDKYDHYSTLNCMKVSHKPAIYIDAYQIGGNFQNNIFENIPIGTVMRSYGQTMKNNIFVDVPVVAFVSKNLSVNAKDSEGNITAPLWKDETTRYLAVIKDNETVQNVWYKRYPAVKDVIETLANRTADEQQNPIINIENNLVFYHNLNNYNTEQKEKNTIVGYDSLVGGSNVENMIFSTNTAIFKDFENKDFGLLAMENAFDLTKIDVNKMGVQSK